MEIATSQLPRIVRLALIGTGTAFAWIVLALVLGLGSGQAHAGEPDDGGLLGGAVEVVTSSVDTTAAAVTDTVSTVATGATTVVNAVVATTPPPVQEPVRQVVHTVGEAVATVTSPVTEAASSGVVSGVAQPVVELVTAVPVVGDAVTAIGLDDAVTDLGGTADDTVGGLVGTVTETGTNVVRPPAGDTPSTPAVPGLSELPGIELPVLADDLEPSTSGAEAAVIALPADDPASMAGAALRVLWSTASVFAAAAVDAVLGSIPALGAGGSPGSAGGLCLPSASAGPGGAGPGAWALVALVPLAAHRAWVRRAGPEDENAPPAPVGSTDVSPD